MVDAIQEMEKMFLYCLSVYGHVTGFSFFAFNTLKIYCKVPKFCDLLISDHFIRFFVKCRTFQALKSWNAKLRDKKVINSKSSKKLVKLSSN